MSTNGRLAAGIVGLVALLAAALVLADALDSAVLAWTAFGLLLAVVTARLVLWWRSG